MTSGLVTPFAFDVVFSTWDLISASTAQIRSEVSSRFLSKSLEGSASISARIVSLWSRWSEWTTSYVHGITVKWDNVFRVFGVTRLGIEPGFPDLAAGQPTLALGRNIAQDKTKAFGKTTKISLVSVVNIQKQKALKIRCYSRMCDCPPGKP